MAINLQLASSSQVSPRCRVYAKQAAAICEDAYEATRAVYQAQTLVSAEEVRYSAQPRKFPASYIRS
jgi:hypothetical protein